MANKVWLCTPSIVEAQAIRAGWLAVECPLYLTGVGAVATTEALWRRLIEEGRPQALVAIGLAGSYTRGLPLYAGVQVRRDVWAGLGRRQARTQKPLPDFLVGKFSQEVQSLAPALPVPQVMGLTLESVSACRKEATFWKRTYPEAALETQENAAYLRFGAVLGIPVYALRLISNRVGERHWSRSAALSALVNFVRDVGFPLYGRLVAGERPPESGPELRGWGL